MCNSQMNFVRIVLGVLGVLFTLLVHAQSGYEMVRELIAEGNTAEAVQRMRDALQDVSDETEMVQLKIAIGWGELELGRYSQSEHALTDAYANAVQLGDARAAGIAGNNLGILKYLQGDLAASEAYFNMEYNANSATAREYKDLIAAKRKEFSIQETLAEGIEFRREKEFGKAVEVFDQVLAEKPSEAAALEYKGYALFRQQDYSAARDALQLAIAADPGRKMAHLNLVKASCAIGDESTVESTIKNSNIPREEFAEWLGTDAEFQRVCAESKYIEGLRRE